jgi:hypothetical protein
MFEDNKIKKTMEKFKSLFAKLGIALAILTFLTIQPTESEAQNYNYKIIRSSEIQSLPGGGILIIDHCTHGPGLCGAAIMH